MILPLEIKQFESIDTQNFLAREARRNFVTSLGPKAPKNLPNLVKSHENFVWDKNLSKYKGGSSKGGGSRSISPDRYSDRHTGH